MVIFHIFVNVYQRVGDLRTILASQFLGGILTQIYIFEIKSSGFWTERGP